MTPAYMEPMADGGVGHTSRQPHPFSRCLYFVPRVPKENTSQGVYGINSFLGAYHHKRSVDFQLVYIRSPHLFPTIPSLPFHPALVLYFESPRFHQRLLKHML